MRIGKDETILSFIIYSELKTISKYKFASMSHMHAYNVYPKLLKMISWVLRLSQEAEFISPLIKPGLACSSGGNYGVTSQSMPHNLQAPLILWITRPPSSAQVQGHVREDKGPAIPAASASSQPKRRSVKEIILDQPACKLSSNTWASSGKISTVALLAHRLRRSNKSLLV